MSNSLVKQSLSLFEDDMGDSQPGVKKRKKSTDPMKQISTKKKGVKKELKKLHNQMQRNRSQKTMKKLPEGYSWYSEDADYTEESVQALQRLEKFKTTDSDTASAIVDYHERTILRGRRKKNGKDKPSEIKTAFTDEDFNKFAEEFDSK